MKISVCLFVCLRMSDHNSGTLPQIFLNISLEPREYSFKNCHFQAFLTFLQIFLT